MKTRTFGVVTLLAFAVPAVFADDAPATPAPAGPTVSSEVLRGYSYQWAPSTRIPVPDAKAPVATPAPAADSGAPVVQLAMFHVTGKPDHTYEGVNAALAEEQNSVPCDLFVKEVSPTFRLKALGPPLWPMEAESAGSKLQPIFPLVTLAW